MGNENGRLRLRAQTVFTAVLERKKTFAELAPKYDLTLEDFEAEVLAKVGPKEYERLKKESDRNGKGKGEDNMKKTRTKKNDPATVPAAIPAAIPAATTVPASVASATTAIGSGAKKVVTREMLQRKLEDARREVSVAEANASAEETLLEAERGKVSDAEKKVASARDALAKAESALQAAQKAFQKQEKKTADKRQVHKEWQDCQQNIEQSIREMDAQLIYLVAPGYKGELPAVGKLISVVPFEGATIEIGDELYKDVTAMDLLESGFEMIPEAKRAYDFARLVIKYEIQDIEVTVLVDDERIKKILRAQEVGF